MPGTKGLRFRERSQSYLFKRKRADEARLRFTKQMTKATESTKSVEVNASAEPQATPEKKRRFRKPQAS